MFGPTSDSQDEVGGPDDALGHKESLGCSLDACEDIVRDSSLAYDSCPVYLAQPHTSSARAWRKSCP